jgi:hypothetical protein
LLRSDGRPLQDTDRVLLMLHGTFSRSTRDLNGLGPSFHKWAQQHYGAILAFDHWTLSKSPEQNAEMLWRQLRELKLHEMKQNAALPPLDVITHSRGGLVARAFVELLADASEQRPGTKGMVRNVAFIGTPNCGTNLANPAHFGAAADMLVNLVHIDPLGLYGRLSALLARMAASMTAEALIRQIPGLWAQNPRSMHEDGFLGRLQATAALPQGVTYSAVAANYEPGGEMNVMKLLKSAGDEVLDAFYKGWNDLVVDTSHVWSVDCQPPGADCAPISPRLKPSNLLVFTPAGTLYDKLRSDKSFKGTQLIRRTGAHHTNLMQLEETRNFLMEKFGAG